jgi:plastocyanin
MNRANQQTISILAWVFSSKGAVMQWFRSAVLCFAVFVAVLAPAVSQQLTITGHIVIDDGETKRNPGIDSAGAVVWFEPRESDARLRWTTDKRYTLAQRNHAFEPHLLIVPVGAKVQFPNQDLVFHNVFSMFQAKRFDLGLYEGGTSKAILFDKPGVSYIFCNIHEQMGAVVIALTAPYYGVSQADGSVRIDHVPAGRYRLRIWAEGASEATLEELTRDVVVTNDLNFGDIQISVTPSVNLIHTNKFGHSYDAGTSSYGNHFQNTSPGHAGVVGPSGVIRPKASDRQDRR